MTNAKLRYIFATFIILAFLLTACTEGQQTGDNSATKGTTSSTSATPESINTFASADEGEIFRFFFQLQDASGKIISADGNGILQIVDDTGKELYKQEISFSTTDFVPYQFQLTGQDVGDAYEWRVRKADIEKGYSEYGEARLTLKSNGKTLTASEDFLDVPSLSGEEVSDYYEQEYQSNKKNIDKSLTRGSFQVDVKSAGFFKELDYSGETEYYRIDILVRNVGDEREYFSPSGMVIIDSDSQYDSSYGGTLEYKDMFPGIKQEGYVIFEVPDGLQSPKLVFELGYDSSYDPLIFEYNLPASSS